MDDKKIDAFLRELTILSHGYGLGVHAAGDLCELYELEPEDTGKTYRCDDDSRIDFV